MSKVTSAEDISKLLVADLKAELKLRDASTAGKKADLIRRLTEIFEREQEVKESGNVASDSMVSNPENSDPSPEIPAEEESNVDAAAAPMAATSESYNSSSAPTESNATSSARTQEKSTPLAVSMIESTMVGGNSNSGTIAAATSDPPEQSKSDEDSSTVSPQGKYSDSGIVEVVPPPPQNKSAVADEEDSNGSKQIIAIETAADVLASPAVELGETVEAVSVPAAPSVHSVRIDNFQRPISKPKILAWLQKELLGSGPDQHPQQHQIADGDLWTNNIKTHCYIDFPTVELAQQCIEKVQGQHFPPGNPKTLVASITKVNAKDAPTDPEAQLLPEMWKQYAAERDQPSVAAAAEQQQQQLLLQEDGRGEGHEDGEELVSGGGEGTGRKRKVLEISVTTSGVGEGGGILFRKVAMKALGTPTNLTPGATATRTLKQQQQQQFQTNETASLDSLFKKTKAQPALYWLPAPDALVERRFKEKLNKKA